jgi:hypothetical protein
MASATPNESPHRAKWPKHPNNKAFDKSVIYSKSPKVADTVIEARFPPLLDLSIKKRRRNPSLARMRYARVRRRF